MPRYDYECESCGHLFELRQSFSSEPVATCPECNSGARRLIRSVPVVFKGSGFYVNDYGKGKSGGSSAPESKDSEAKKDPKPKSEESSKDKPKKEPSTTK